MSEDRTLERVEALVTDDERMEIAQLAYLAGLSRGIEMGQRLAEPASAPPASTRQQPRRSP